MDPAVHSCTVLHILHCYADFACTLTVADDAWKHWTMNLCAKSRAEKTKAQRRHVAHELNDNLICQGRKRVFLSRNRPGILVLPIPFLCNSFCIFKSRVFFHSFLCLFSVAGLLSLLCKRKGAAHRHRPCATLDFRAGAFQHCEKKTAAVFRLSWALGFCHLVLVGSFVFLYFLIQPLLFCFG